MKEGERVRLNQARDEERRQLRKKSNIDVQDKVSKQLKKESKKLEIVANRSENIGLGKKQPAEKDSSSKVQRKQPQQM